MPDNKVVTVEVLQGTQASGGCSCCSSSGCAAGSCGTADYEELTNKLAEDLQQNYSDKVVVKYVDVDKEGLDKYPLMQKVLRLGYSYPITFIDGRPKFAGAIMTPEIKKCIDEILKDDGSLE